MTNKFEFFGGELLSKLVLQLLSLNKVNKAYNQNVGKSGKDFINSVLSTLEIKFEIKPEELDRIPEKGPFITVSNHPFGGVDSLLLYKIIASKRPDFKLMENYVFYNMDSLKDVIIPIFPFDLKPSESENIGGFKQGIAQLQNGLCLGVFPAYEVSTYQPEHNQVRDKEWNNEILKFIKHSEVPVVPLYFQGNNQRLFQLLGRLHPLLRTAHISNQVFNKPQKIIKVRIGYPVPIKELNEFPDISKFGRFLRAKTYALGTTIHVKKFFRSPGFGTLNKTVQPLIEPVSPDILDAEFTKLSKNYLLFSQNNFSVICAPSMQMPNLFTEIGRLREVTFREVGEGTNRSIDIDEYDLYYNQLVIWDETNKKIVGAYRLGKGKDILNQYGKSGFYLNSLFKISNSFLPVLNESIELGRSFIAKEYQRKPLSLYLLWKGILYFLIKNVEYRYLIGPVSISNQFSNFSKELIVEFIRKNYYNHNFAQYIEPRNKFKVNQNLNFDKDIFFQNASNDINKIDNFIRDNDPELKTPVLIKKYLKLNAKIIGFNIDPKFNDCLDGLIVLDIFQVPAESIKTLSKEINDTTILERFNYDDF